MEDSTGHVIWRESPAGFLEAIPFLSSPANSSHQVFFADNLGSLSSIDLASGKTIWKADLSDRPNTSVAIAGTDVIVGTIDGFLNWVDADSGTVRHRVSLDGYPYGTLVVLPSTVLVLVHGTTAKLMAIDSLTGQIRWTQEAQEEWTTYRPLVVGSVVIIGSPENGLCAINQSNGAVRWRRPVEGVPRGLSISSDRILYMGSLAGTVQAYRLTKADID